MAAEPDEAVNAVVAWWFWLQPGADVPAGAETRLRRETGESRTARARLRRAASLFDALLLAETQALIRRVHATGENRADLKFVALAVMLAHVGTTSNIPFATALGLGPDGRSPDPKKDERPRLSPARFATLMRAAHDRDWERFARTARRAFAIIDLPFDIYGFIRDVLHLNDRTLQRWTYQYWQTNTPEWLAEAVLDVSSNGTEANP